MKTFKNLQLVACAALLISGTVPCAAAQPLGKGCPVTGDDLSQLMKITKVDFIPQWNKPEAQFQEDKDPESLEIVVVSDPKDGPNAVSSDGQVIFQQKNAPDSVMQKLIPRAFYIRFVLANYLTAKCKGPWNHSQ